MRVVLVVLVAALLLAGIGASVALASATGAGDSNRTIVVVPSDPMAAEPVAPAPGAAVSETPTVGPVREPGSRTPDGGASARTGTAARSTTQTVGFGVRRAP